MVDWVIKCVRLEMLHAPRQMGKAL
jgi:hypothetical protein